MRIKTSIHLVINIINLYIAKHAALADKDCAFLYEQGVKDCVKLLKRLGVL